MVHPSIDITLRKSFVQRQQQQKKNEQRWKLFNCKMFFSSVLIAIVSSNSSGVSSYEMQPIIANHAYGIIYSSARDRILQREEWIATYFIELLDFSFFFYLRFHSFSISFYFEIKLVHENIDYIRGLKVKSWCNFLDHFSTFRAPTATEISFLIPIKLMQSIFTHTNTNKKVATAAIKHLIFCMFFFCSLSISLSLSFIELNLPFKSLSLNELRRRVLETYNKTEKLFNWISEQRRLILVLISHGIGWGRPLSSPSPHLLNTKINKHFVIFGRLSIVKTFLNIFDKLYTVTRHTPSLLFIDENTFANWW